MSSPQSVTHSEPQAALSRSIDLARLSSEWTVDNVTLFASPAWFTYWFAAFGNGEFGVWAPEDGSSWAIPYVICTRQVAGLTLRIAQGATNAYTPQFDVIGSGGPSILALRRMMKDLGCAMVGLHSLGAQSTALREKSLTGPGAFADVAWTESTPVIDCTGDWNYYLHSRGKSRRSEWIDKERAFAKTGGEFLVWSSWSEIGPRFDEILEVEASGWKGRNGTAISQVPGALRFFRAVCPALAAAGKLRVFALVRESRILAFKICTLHGGRLSSLKTGYLDALAKQSPGQVLQLLVTRSCFEHPDTAIFDFLSPPTPHKLAWATRRERLYSLRVYRPSPTGAIARLRWSVMPQMRKRTDSLIARARGERSIGQDTEVTPTAGLVRPD